MRTRVLAAGVVATGLALALTSAPRAQESTILGALQDEMTRSMAGLRLQGEPAPYFIEYEIDETRSMRTTAWLGSTVSDFTNRGRTLRVVVKVGDYAFDSSRFITQDRGAGLVPVLGDGGMVAPLDDDYDAMRRQIWLTTDAAYKRAVSVFAKKKAAFQNRIGTDPLGDFSHETPVETVLPAAPPASDGHEWAERARQLSRAFGAVPEIENSEVFVSSVQGTGYYLNSEGFKAVAPIQLAYLRAAAEAQAPDGMTVRDLFGVVEGRLEDLPPMSELMARTRALAERVKAERTAPIGEEFTGPVLLEGDASAELIRQSLVPLMLARRPADGENPRQGGGQATPFLSRIGLRVLSDSFVVADTPSLKEFDGRPVPGSYVVDDEAVRAKDVTLVEKGRLVTLLSSRTPQKNLLQSNGHGRSGTVQAGVFQMRSTMPVAARDLKAKYLELLKVQDKPFGYIVRAIAGPGDVPGGGQGGPIVLQAVKVTPDGKEEPIRGLRFAGIPSTAFRDILEASDERTLYNYRLNGATAASVIVPSLIFEELELQRTREISQKPPVVPAP